MMRRRRIPSSLKLITTQLLARLTTNAFRNIFREELPENNSNRKRNSGCKRKRRYSCGDEVGELNKRLKTENRHLDGCGEVCRKRMLDDNDEDEELESRKKRQKVEHAKDVHYHQNISGVDTTKDDISVSYHLQNSALDILRKYLCNIPTPCWDQYSDLLINGITNRIKSKTISKESISKTIELLFCEKLINFSTKIIETFVADAEDILYRNLKFCRNLASLEITLTPSSERAVIMTLMSLQRLRNLQVLHLLPNTRYSYHWAFEDIAQNCSKLRELKIVYDGDSVKGDDLDCVRENDGNSVRGDKGIGILHTCHNLRAIWFFNYGRKSETKSLTELLSSLVNVKILFHKELPNAILELPSVNANNDNNLTTMQPPINLCCLDSVDYITANSSGDARAGYLGLERVDLCWYQQGIGYQLVYVPSSYLLRVAQTCPKLSLINLVGSTCLSQIICRLQHLQAIVLQQTSFASSLRCTLKETQLEKLTVLRVSDVWDITYDMISSVAQSCPNLQVLSISCSSLEARGRLTRSTKRSPFACLRHLTLVPTTLDDRPSLTEPSVWQLGTALMSYVLQDALLLTSIHLQYKQDDLPFEDMPTESDLDEILCVPRHDLKSLILEFPPAVGHEFVTNLVDVCPELIRLGNLTTWPLTNEQCAHLITTYSSIIDIS